MQVPPIRTRRSRFPSFALQSRRRSCGKAWQLATSSRLRSLRRLTLALVLAALLAPAATLANAQTMARRGWSGGASEAEPWWHRATFYRLDPARFQASGTAPVGDLSGIALRLDYLQSLGIDALILDPGPGSSSSPDPTPNPDPAPNPAPNPDSALPATPTAIPPSPFVPDAFEDLLREAGRHNLRVLPTLTPALQHGDRAHLLAIAHDWLAAGAAGLALPSPPNPTPAEAAAYASLAAQLTQLLRSMPGDRVLLTGPASFPAAPLSTLPGNHAQNRVPPRSGRLFAAALLPSNPATPAALRSPLLSLQNTSAQNPATYPLLCLAPASQPPAPDTHNRLAAAAVLFASPAAALFDFGTELGLDTAPSSSPVPSQAPLMQWTPTNVRQATPAPAASLTEPAPGQPTPFGAYKPFVRPPPPTLVGADPAAPVVALDRNLPPTPPDPATLPGFTAGTLPVPPTDGARLNVATQAADPHSTLNAFRALLALRRGNPALRDGPQLLLHPQDTAAVVFLRRAGHAATVVVAANLGDTPLLLSLDAELRSLHLPTGPLRALFSAGPQTLTGESTTALRLPPHAVFLGELRPR